MITDSTHGLDLDGLNLTDDLESPAVRSRGWWIRTLQDGTGWGNPEPLVKEITTFLQDGAIETTESYGLREMTVNLLVGATSSAELAAAEAAIVAAKTSARALTWTPPDDSVTGSGEPCVFEVVRVEFDFVELGLGELRLERPYTLTIRALPYSKAETQVSLAVPPLAPGTPLQTTSIDEGNSTSGWAARGTSGVALSASGGKVQAKYTNNSGKAISNVAVEAYRSGLNVPLAAGYLRVVYDTPGAGRQGAYSYPVSANGQQLTEVARDGRVGWYAYPGGTLTSFSARYNHGLSSAVGSYLAIQVDSVRWTNLPQDGASGSRQMSRTLDVHGTVRTQGNLAVSDETPAGLGSVLVYTATQQGGDFSPPLRPRLSSGNDVTSEGTLVSGGFSDLSTMHTFDVPATSVAPGGYLLLARVRNPSAGSFSIAWQGLSVQGGVVVDTGTDFPRGTAAGTLTANVWTVVSVGRMVLPTFALGSAGQVRVTMQAAGLQLDEAWLFNMDTGQLTWVECGLGTPAAGGASSRVWLDAASLESPVPALSHGTAADRSDARGPGLSVRSFGQHQFVPPAASVFTVTTGSVAAGLALSYYPRFHTHVVDTWS